MLPSALPLPLCCSSMHVPIDLLDVSSPHVPLCTHCHCSALGLAVGAAAPR